MSTFLRTFYEYFCQNIAVHLKSKVGKVGTVNIPLSLFTLSLNIKHAITTALHLPNQSVC